MIVVDAVISGVVQITSVDVDGENSIGYFIREGVLQSLPLTYGEALAILNEIKAGADSVGYQFPEGNK